MSSRRGLVLFPRTDTAHFLHTSILTGVGICPPSKKILGEIAPHYFVSLNPKLVAIRK